MTSLLLGAFVIAIRLVLNNESWKGDRVVFSFTPTHETSAKMSVNGLIPYLRFKYGEDAMDFFNPYACLEKEDWTQDHDAKTIHNPLSKDLDDLDGGDADYNFSVYSKITNAEDSASAAMTENIPYAATNVAQNHLDRVVQGLDNDSIYTLGNGTVNRFTPRTWGNCQNPSHDFCTADSEPKQWGQSRRPKPSNYGKQSFSYRGETRVLRN